MLMIGVDRIQTLLTARCGTRSVYKKEYIALVYFISLRCLGVFTQRILAHVNLYT